MAPRTGTTLEQGFFPDVPLNSGFYAAVTKQKSGKKALLSMQVGPML